MTISRPAAAPLLLAVALAALAPPAASAQCGACDSHAPRLRGEALTVAANALVGGVSAGLQLRARGGSFRDGFVRGAAGGALTYAGKRVSAETFGGAGLLGRQVAAVGSSLSRNAADGRGALERVMLPLGPVRLYVERGAAGGTRLQPRLDLAALAAAGYAATRPGARLDARESLLSGALVFTRPGDAAELGFNGMQAAGVIQVRVRHPGSPPDPAFAEQVARTTAHERVHVVQYDQTFLLWAAPAERALMDGARWSRGINRWADLGLNAPLLMGMGAVVPYEARPWEKEAYFLSRTRAAGEEYGGDPRPE